MTFSALRNFALSLFALAVCQACIIDPLYTDCSYSREIEHQIDALIINTSSSDLVLIKDTAFDGGGYNIEHYPIDSTRELTIKAGESLYLDGPRQGSCLKNFSNAYEAAIDSVYIRYLADSLEVVHSRSADDTAAPQPNEPTHPITSINSWEDSTLVDNDSLVHWIEIYHISPEDRKEAQRIGKPF